MKDNRNLRETTKVEYSFNSENRTIQPVTSKKEKNNKYHLHNTAKVSTLDANNKIFRRYSFDDNGGGYLGL